MDFNPQQIKHRLIKLPPVLQDALISSDVIEKIVAVAIDNDIPQSSAEALISEVMWILLGLKTTRDLAKNIENKVGVAKETAQKICEDLYLYVFKPLEEPLRMINNLGRLPFFGGPVTLPDLKPAQITQAKPLIGYIGPYTTDTTPSAGAKLPTAPTSRQSESVPVGGQTFTPFTPSPSQPRETPLYNALSANREFTPHSEVHKETGTLSSDAPNSKIPEIRPNTLPSLIEQKLRGSISMQKEDKEVPPPQSIIKNDESKNN